MCIGACVSGCVVVRIGRRDDPIRAAVAQVVSSNEKTKKRGERGRIANCGFLVSCSIRGAQAVDLLCDRSAGATSETLAAGSPSSPFLI